MSLDYEWGPWIEHDGSGCPCIGKYVHVKLQGMSDRFGIAGSECHEHRVSPNCPIRSAWVNKISFPATGNVLEYRIRRPLVRKYLQEITETLPEMEDA